MASTQLPSPAGNSQVAGNLYKAIVKLGVSPVHLVEKMWNFVPELEGVPRMGTGSPEWLCGLSGGYPVLRRPLLVTQWSEASFIRAESMRKPDKTTIRNSPRCHCQTDNRLHKYKFWKSWAFRLSVWRLRGGFLLIMVLSGFRIASVRIKLVSDCCVTNSGRRSTGYLPTTHRATRASLGPSGELLRALGQNFTFFSTKWTDHTLWRLNLAIALRVGVRNTVRNHTEIRESVSK